MLRIKLNEPQKDELRQVARQAVGRVSERAHFALLSAAGYSSPEIGELMGYDVQTVRSWFQSYQERGSAGLKDKPRCGRPCQEPYLTAVVQAQAGQPPANSGYLQACWTVALLVLHLAQRFRIMVSPATVRRALHRARFRWKRPKLAPARRRDPQADSKRERIAQILAESEAIVVAEDECDMHLLAVLRAMWQRIGEQIRIPTPGQNAKRGVFGGVNLRNGEWFYCLTEHKRGADFIDFLTQLLIAYPVGKIYVLVDNASIHTSKAVKLWVSQHTCLELVYLPTYSSHQLNPVEKVWWALKGEIAANRCFKHLGDLDMAIHRFFAKFSPSDALDLINSEIVRNAQSCFAQM
jgi:putative transposase